MNSGSVDQGQPARQANSETCYTVTAGDLPLSCPMPGMTAWNSHPRVFLAVEQTGEAICPYCGALYVLRAPAEA